MWIDLFLGFDCFAFWDGGRKVLLISCKNVKFIKPV